MNRTYCGSHCVWFVGGYRGASVHYCTGAVQFRPEDDGSWPVFRVCVGECCRLVEMVPEQLALALGVTGVVSPHI